MHHVLGQILTFKLNYTVIILIYTIILNSTIIIQYHC